MERTEFKEKILAAYNDKKLGAQHVNVLREMAVKMESHSLCVYDYGNGITDVFGVAFVPADKTLNDEAWSTAGFIPEEYGITHAEADALQAAYDNWAEAVFFELGDEIKQAEEEFLTMVTNL